MNNFIRFAFSSVLAIFIPMLTANVYAQPVSSVVIGDMASTTNNYSLPINNYYGYSYTQQLYYASEINRPAGGTITKIYFYWTGGSTNDLINSNNWTIYIGHTSKTSYSSTTDWVPYADLTQVFSGIVDPGTSNGWMELVLTTPFVYNGTDNIVVAGWENESDYPGSGSTFKTTPAAASAYKSIGFYSDGTQADPASPPTASTRYTYYPNIKLDFLLPPDNAGIDSIFTAAVPFCSGIQPLSARVHNYGSNVINSVNVNWSIDGVEQTPVMLSTPVDMENTTAGPYSTIVLGNVDFPYNTSKTILAWTSMPNGVSDTKPDNDSSIANISATLEGIEHFLISPQDSTICAGSTITLDAGSHPKNPIYVWSNGIITQTNTVSGAGVISVRVQNTDGCTARDTVTISVLPFPVANSIAIINNGNSSYTFNVISAENIDSYVWDFDDGTTVPGTGIPGEQVHPFAAPGQYTVTLTMSNECGEIVLTQVVDIENTTGIGELSALQKAIRLFPNPAKDVVTISGAAGAKIIAIGIFNLVGQQVYANKAVHAETQEVNISGMASGIYNVVINTEQGKITKKLEVIK